MGTRGRNAKPLPKTLPGNTDERPTPLKDMTKKGKIVWKAIVDDFHQSYYSPRNFALLAAFCEAAARHSEACSQLEKEGLIVFNETTGVVKKNPLLNIVDSAAAQMVQLSTKLGLSIDPQRPKESKFKRSSRLDGLINNFDRMETKPPRDESLVYRG